MNGDLCICCGESPAIDENGCCGHCHWQLVGEAERGLDELAVYLARQRPEAA